LLEALFE